MRLSLGHGAGLRWALAAALALGSAGAAAQDDPAPAPNSIFLEIVEDADSRDVLLRVEAVEIEDLYGLAFDLRFDKKLLRWEKNGPAEVGDFLAAEGEVECQLLVRQRGRGRLVVGVTRLGAVEGASGSGTVMTLAFQKRKKEGEREFTVEANRAFDSAANILDELAWTVDSFD